MIQINKIRITLRISSSLYEYFKTKPGYQRMINEILIRYVDRQTQNYGIYKLLSMFDQHYQKLEYFKTSALENINDKKYDKDFENLIKEFDEDLSNLFDHEYYYLNAFKEHSIDGQDEVLASTLALIGLYRDGFTLYDEVYALSDLSKKEYSIAIVKMMLLNLVFLGDLSDGNGLIKEAKFYDNRVVVKFLFEIALQNRFPIDIMDDFVIGFTSLGLQTNSSKTCIEYLLSKFLKSRNDFIHLTEDEINKFRFRVGLTELADKQLINCVPMGKNMVVILNVKVLRRNGLIK